MAAARTSSTMLTVRQSVGRHAFRGHAARGHAARGPGLLHGCCPHLQHHADCPPVGRATRVPRVPGRHAFPGDTRSRATRVPGGDTRSDTRSGVSNSLTRTGGAASMSLPRLRAERRDPGGAGGNGSAPSSCILRRLPHCKVSEMRLRFSALQSSPQAFQTRGSSTAPRSVPERGQQPTRFGKNQDISVSTFEEDEGLARPGVGASWKSLALHEGADR